MIFQNWYVDIFYFKKAVFSIYNFHIITIAMQKKQRLLYWTEEFTFMTFRQTAKRVIKLKFVIAINTTMIDSESKT